MPNTAYVQVMKQIYSDLLIAIGLTILTIQNTPPTLELTSLNLKSL